MRHNGLSTPVSSHISGEIAAKPPDGDVQPMGTSASGATRRLPKRGGCLALHEDGTIKYAEFAVTTNFSFLRGASHPEELVVTADLLGLAAIGIADRNSFAGIVRAYDEARKRSIRLLVGTRLVTGDGFEVIAYPATRQAYGRLCRLLTKGNLKGKKGECH